MVSLPSQCQKCQRSIETGWVDTESAYCGASNENTADHSPKMVRNSDGGLLSSGSSPRSPDGEDPEESPADDDENMCLDADCCSRARILDLA